MQKKRNEGLAVCSKLTDDFASELYPLAQASQSKAILIKQNAETFSSSLAEEHSLAKDALQDEATEIMEASTKIAKSISEVGESWKAAEWP